MRSYHLLRSPIDMHRAVVDTIRTNYVDYNFAVKRPCVWNSLPPAITCVLIEHVQRKI